MQTSLQVRINRARLEHVARRHMQASARRAGARALASRYQVCFSSPRTVGNLAFIAKWLPIWQMFNVDGDGSVPRVSEDGDEMV